MRGTRPGRRPKSMSETMEALDKTGGSFMLLHHRENRPCNRIEARVCGPRGNDRILIHLRNERKQDLLFLLYVRKQVSVEIVDRSFDFLLLGWAIAALGSKRVSHCGEARQLRASAPVMNAHNMLDQSTQRQATQRQAGGIGKRH